MAVTDLCRACEEAEPPGLGSPSDPGRPARDRCSAGRMVGQELGQPWDRREIASVATARLLQLQVQIAGLGQAARYKQVSRGSPGSPVLHR